MKERLIGACVLVALGVIFIPMFFKGPDPGATVTRDVALPAPSSAVRSYRMSLLENDPPQPISPLVAAGKAPAQARSGTIDRTTAPVAGAGKTAPKQIRTMPIDVPAPQADKPAPAASKQAAQAEDPDIAKNVDNDPGWAVQVGSFANPDNAMTLMKQLKAKGFHSFIKRYANGPKTLYRVRVGPVDARREAEKLAPAVAAASGGPTEVVSNP